MELRKEKTSLETEKKLLLGAPGGGLVTNKLEEEILN